MNKSIYHSQNTWITCAFLTVKKLKFEPLNTTQCRNQRRKFMLKALCETLHRPQPVSLFKPDF
ncbi:hypothetical protein THF1D04_30089 [Vibrio owensii]|uniref:Uncharacterized protein n=1 Tax=Vibrio owensii TaxID=696485 RepID=A0AAU9Q6C7_9VIBR|nr:hypothetical protein THF1D04_30089 [Vibrio owensii]